MKPRKETQHAAIRARASRAILDLYHNATPRYPRDVPEQYSEFFQSWFDDTARFEIEYIQDGGAYGSNYRATLAAPCNAGQYKSEKARAYYVRKGMRAMERERDACARWERISEFGTLYSYGRGGRTLAPDGLINTRGGSSFSTREHMPEEMTVSACVELIQTVEAFNSYVSAWCKSVPEIWREYFSEFMAEKRLEKRREKHAAKIARVKAKALRTVAALSEFQPAN